MAIGICAAIGGCSSGSSPEAQPPESSLGQDEAALVAAVAASEDENQDATSGLGVEPFWVKGCGFGAIVSQIRERVDADGDGKWSGEERAALAHEFGDPADRVALLLSLYDADGSGALDATELGQLESDVQARCQRREAALIARFDTDGDGRLSDAEREAARAALRARFGRRHRGHVDGDAGAGVRDESPRDRRERVWSHFDADGDGKLDGEEGRAFGEHMRGCVRGEHPMDPGEPTPPGEDGDEEPAQPDAGAN